MIDGLCWLELVVVLGFNSKVYHYNPVGTNAELKYSNDNRSHRGDRFLTQLPFIPLSLYRSMLQPTCLPPTTSNKYHREHLAIVLANLKRWTGYDLVADYSFAWETLGEQVFAADFYILSHNNAAEPILNYGNDRVLKLWEISWEELTTMYSRDTAKPVERSTRLAIMERVRADNYLSGYSGLRISKTGREFKILDVTIWNLFATNGEPYGQAALFKSIDRLDLL